MSSTPTTTEAAGGAGTRGTTRIGSAANFQTNTKIGHYLWIVGLLAAIRFLIAFFSVDLNTPWTQGDYYNGAAWSQAAKTPAVLLMRQLARAAPK